MKKKSKDKRWIDCGEDVYVLYNENWTEFDIHSRLCFRLAMIPGFTVKTETPIKCGKKGVIADIMMFKDLRPVCAIEVKKAKIQSIPQDKKQLEIYKTMTELVGIPIFYCQGFKDIKPTFRRVYNYLYERHGVKQVNEVIQ